MDKKSDSKLKKFIAENKSLALTIPVFAILIVILVVLYAGQGGKVKDTVGTTSPAPTLTPVNNNDQTEVSVLPSSNREKDESEIVRNPFAVPYKVSGIIYDSKGDSIAVVEAENKTFILKENDKADNLFVLKKIEVNSVTINIEGTDIVLKIID